MIPIKLQPIRRKARMVLVKTLLVVIRSVLMILLLVSTDQLNMIEIMPGIYTPLQVVYWREGSEEEGEGRAKGTREDR
jgi:hypothetical protein